MNLCIGDLDIWFSFVTDLVKTKHSLRPFKDTYNVSSHREQAHVYLQIDEKRALVGGELVWSAKSQLTF